MPAPTIWSGCASHRRAEWKSNDVRMRAFACARACVLETPIVAANAIARSLATACALAPVRPPLSPPQLRRMLKVNCVATASALGRDREGTNRCSRAPSPTDPAMPIVGVRTTHLPVATLTDCLSACLPARRGHSTCLPLRRDQKRLKCGQQDIIIFLPQDA